MLAVIVLIVLWCCLLIIQTRITIIETPPTFRLILLNRFVVKTFKNEKCTSKKKSGGDEDAHDDCELQSAPNCEANLSEV